MEKERIIILGRIGYVFIVLWILSLLLYAQQDLRTSLFAEADEALKQVRQTSADILSPQNYERGMEAYIKAEKDLKKGKNLEDIRQNLKTATTYFRKAIENSRLSAVSLQNVVKAREDAISAHADQSVPKLWEEAEKKFKEAAISMEKGDLKKSREKGEEAEKLYREAELEAIKINYLADTWNLIEKARKSDVDKKAPTTLNKAEELVKQAEKMLNENRYDTDEARDLAKKANYEARHAFYLSNSIRQMEKKDVSLEELLLLAEEPLQRIASALDMNVEFDRGFNEPTEKIIAKIRFLSDSLENSNQRINDLEQSIADLKARIEEMQNLLGGLHQEQTELEKKIQLQEEIRRRFAEMEQIFDRSEAKVLREGQNIIIRLIGLNFDVGKSVIRPDHFTLLTKVQQAIKMFENADIEIQGHTDSYGSDEVNLKLSQERAEAVRAYLLANMAISPDRLTAVGYGENVPIANNETAEGRKKNRRIDIVIKPKF